MYVTVVPHRVGQFCQVWQQFSLQTDRHHAEAPEQGLGSQAVLLVLTEQHHVITVTNHHPHLLLQKKLNNNAVQLFLRFTDNIPVGCK